MHWAFVTVGLGAAAAPLPAGDLAVSVSVDHCLSVEQREVERLTALELGVRAVGTEGRGGESAESPVTRVTVSCVGEHVRLRVVDRLTGKTLERTLSLTTREVDVAGRAVALAAAELVLTSWAELTLTKAKSVPEPLDVRPAARPLAAERVLSRTERGVRLRYLLAFGGAIGPFDGVGVGYGGGLRLSVAFGRYGFGADWDLATHRAFAETSLGDVDATVFSSGLFARFTLETAPLFADFGAGARGGIARLEGRPTDADVALGSVVAGTWVGPAGALGVGVRVASVAVRAGFEAGYVLHGVAGEVDQGPRVAVAGAWFSGTLGIGWAP
jgi:hypothetical protein